MKMQFLYLSEVNALLLPSETVIAISVTILVHSLECTSFSRNFMAHYTFSFVEKNPRVISRLSCLSYSRVLLSHMKYDLHFVLAFIFFHLAFTCFVIF